MFGFFRRSKLNSTIEHWMEAERMAARLKAQQAESVRVPEEECVHPIAQEDVRPSGPSDEEPLRVPTLLRVGNPQD